MPRAPNTSILTHLWPCQRLLRLLLAFEALHLLDQPRNGSVVRWLSCKRAAAQGMEGAKIGIWCAHGEGQAKFPDSRVHQDVLAQDLAPVRCLSRLSLATTKADAKSKYSEAMHMAACTCLGLLPRLFYGSFTRHGCRQLQPSTSQTC